MRRPENANERRRSAAENGLVDPRAPRSGRGITATPLLVGAALADPVPVYAVAAILSVSALSRWRLDLYGLLWRRVAVPVVGPPDDRESASPHRFAKLLGATGTVVASALPYAGFTVAGFAVALPVALLAGVAATTGFCLGCRLYRQVSFLRDRRIA